MNYTRNLSYELGNKSLLITIHVKPEVSNDSLVFV